MTMEGADMETHIAQSQMMNEIEEISKTPSWGLKDIICTGWLMKKKGLVDVVHGVEGDHTSFRNQPGQETNFCSPLQESFRMEQTLFCFTRKGATGKV